jgi:hypothetical protein
MHLQFKLTLSEKKLTKQNKIKKYTKKQWKCAKFWHVVCDSVVKLQKNLVPKNKKKYFAECLGLTLGKVITLPSAKQQALGKEDGAPLQSLPSVWLCRVPRLPLPSARFCRVRHSAKQVFAECLKFGTRQRRLHSAKSGFPVVVDDIIQIICSFIVYNI